MQKYQKLVMYDDQRRNYIINTQKQFEYEVFTHTKTGLLLAHICVNVNKKDSH